MQTQKYSLPSQLLSDIKYFWWQSTRFCHKVNFLGTSRSNVKVKFLESWPWTWPIFHRRFGAQTIYYCCKIFWIGSYHGEQCKSFFCESICNEISNIFNFSFQMMIRSVPVFFHHCLFLLHGLQYLTSGIIGGHWRSSEVIGGHWRLTGRHVTTLNVRIRKFLTLFRFETFRIIFKSGCEWGQTEKSQNRTIWPILL